jgi:hypothetical protein
MSDSGTVESHSRTERNLPRNAESKCLSFQP